jgi:tripartite-type tricarboxylate transporter receptor subunit TctC
LLVSVVRSLPAKSRGKMTTKMKTRACFIAFILILTSPAAADTTSRSYPERPIRVIVPFTAGGGADLIARTVTQKMSEDVGQPLVIDNRVGADGNIGAEMAAHAVADGYTILLGYVGNLAIGPALRRKLPFDPARDFAAITMLAAAPNIFVVHPSVPANDLREFIAYVKANPRKVSFSSAVVGSPGHLAGELLNHAAGIEMVHIPYKGAAQAIVDVMGGHVQAMFGVSTVIPHIRSGKLRALATTGAHRSPLLPKVPTIAESGFPGFEASAWYGLLAPARTPREIILQLHAAAARALKMPEVTDKLEAGGFDVVESTPEAFTAYIKSEIKKWREIVAVSGIKVD